jgi:peptidoglycan/xylan/chitin deacetylase (PgdA/CDA1 family)/predicted ATP-grasp superfamily ATP-dependent carboligase
VTRRRPYLGRVLITEGAERGPLAACRSLAALGYSVSAAADTGLAPALRSRSCDERLMVPSPKREPAGFVSALERIAQRRDYAVLLPGGDASLLAISRRGRRLEDLVRIGLPPAETVERSVDKIRLLEDGAAAGMPPPPTVVCSSPAEVGEAADEVGYPVMLKPRCSILEEAGGIRHLAVARASSREEAESAAAALGLPVIVQRYETNVQRLSCGGVFAHDELLGLAVARFMRTWPPGAGAASFAETVEPPSGLVESAVTLLRAVGWEGIFELEVLAFPDGHLAAMDLNPRLFGWLALSISAGADLPAVWCEVLRGGRPRHAVARAGYRYRWEDAELSNLVRLVRAKRIRDAVELTLPRRRVTHAHFYWRDPMPLPTRAANVLRRRAGPGPPVNAVPLHRSRLVRPAKTVLVRTRSTRWSLARKDGEPQGLRILFYHRVSDERDDLAVTPRRFREQMDYLLREGYSVLDVHAAFEQLETGQLPPRTVAVNFDDGYQDVVEHALPVLAERGFRATVFVVSAAVDGTATFSWYRRQPQLIGWDDIVALDREGTLRFEAHSVSHPNLAILPVDEAAAEIRDSKLALEARLGRKVRVFCYPGGIFTAREEALVADAGFEVAVSCDPGLNLSGGDRFALFRQSVEPGDNLLDFRAKLSGGHDTPLPLQRLYRRLRYPTEPPRTEVPASPPLRQ